MIIGICEVKAVDFYPQANFGKYGIPHHSTVEEYQQYVGQTVIYLKEGKAGSDYDENGFIKKGGSYSKEYLISKISGYPSKMTIVLTERNEKKKIKFSVNIIDEHYDYGDYMYYITDKYTMPLLFIDKFNEDKVNYVGKVYPSNPNSPVHLEITDMIMQEQESNAFNLHKSYPKPVFVLTNKADNSTITYDISDVEDLNELGKVYTNSMFKCTYTVVNIKKKENTDKVEKIYTVKNSITGKIKDVLANKANHLAFDGDDSGKFYATLYKIEKPSNSAVRYGKTTSITEKNITKFGYVDNYIDILIFAIPECFNFVIKNVSDNTIKVIWNEAVFVDIDGSTSKIMHSGIKYSEKEGDQPASTIIKGAKLDDVAVPINKVYYSTVLKEWINTTLYSQADISKKQVIKLMLPIQVKDIINEYIFEFTLNYEYNYPELLIFNADLKKIISPINK